MLKNRRWVKTAALLMLVMTLVSAMLTGCGRKSENTAEATISNGTSEVIENVVLKSGNEETQFGSIAGDESVGKDVTFFADGGLVISYTLNGEALTSSVDVDYSSVLNSAKTVSIDYSEDENGKAVFKVSSKTAFSIMLGKVDDFVWGIPLIVMILLVGLLLTCRTRLTQVFHLGKALKFMVKNEDDGEGEVTSFGALCTALSATIGTGNIVGVATAVCAGGPGALFWMEVAAFLGMATKYAEGLLAVKYRTIDENGKVLGGPFYYIEKGLGKGWKWLAVLFAIFGVLAGIMGIGTITQVNGITSCVNNFFSNSSTAITLFGNDYTWATVISGIIVTVCVALVVIGGLKRIAKVSEIVVPFMAILYVVFAVTLIIYNIREIPAAIVLIVKAAFNPAAVTGGVVGTVFIAMQKGIARGIFSNEAGLGSAPIAAAAAQTKQPARQGLVCMTGTFFDTIIICTMTGLSIVLTGAWKVEGLEGAAVTTYAFQNGLPFLPGSVAAFILMICLAFFAFTTILGWDYYSEKCLQYLVGDKKSVLLTYRWLYIAAVFVGPYLTVSAVWTFADIFNGLMALPNVIALIALSGVVAKETKMFIDGLKSGKLQ